MSKLHTVDLYFWTVNDAARFTDSLKRLLAQRQLDLSETPAATEHRDSMSPVVEKLERAAVYSPPHPRTPSALSVRQARLSAQSSSPQVTYPSPYSTSSQTSIAPYNPAAPAAPEPIAHREKTPPPEDGDAGTGLNATAMHEQGSQASVGSSLVSHSSFQQTPQRQAYPGPPQRSASVQSMPPPPPTAIPSTTNMYQATAASHMPLYSVPLSLPLPSAPAQSSSHGQPHQAHTSAYVQPQSSGHSYPITLPLQSLKPSGTPGPPQLYSHATPLHSSGLSQHPLQSPDSQPARSGYAIGSHSTDSHSPQAQPQHLQADTYSVHGQRYQPTQAEASHGHTKQVQPSKPGAFEGGIGRLEKGVGRFLRKLDNKI